MSSRLDAEGLAVAQAVYKLASARVKTGEPGNLRGTADAVLLGMREDCGCSRIDLLVGGVPVGSLSVVERGGYEVEDMAAFGPVAEGLGLAEARPDVDLSLLTAAQLRAVAEFVRGLYPPAATTRYVLAKGWEGAFGHSPDGSCYALATGEVADGLAWRPRTSTRISGCEPERVAAALGPGIDLAGFLASGAE